MKLQSFGAAGEVTGSCHLLEVGNQRVLLDCGLIQGNRKSAVRNFDSFPFDPKEIDAVILSHAHIDHSGRIPFLMKQGFSGPVYTHSASFDLAEILLNDAAFLQEKEAERSSRRSHKKRTGGKDPLYTQADVARVLRQFRPLSYDKSYQILPNILLRLRDAGHILGSAIVELELSEEGETRKLVFSGDLGNSGAVIIEDPTVIDDADVVMLESTYGDRLHRSREETQAEIFEVVSQARQAKGNILIPAFSVGRSQSVLYWMAEHFEEAGLAEWQIFLDSPLAIKATEIYARHKELYDFSAKHLWQSAQGKQLLPNLNISSTTEESKAIGKIDSGAIIIAGSGMCTGGRIQYHLRNYASNPETHIIFVGYQAFGTPGRAIVDGASEIRMHGQPLKIAAQVHTIGGLSAHADQEGLVQWYGNFRNRPPVLIVHGEAGPQQCLAKRLREEMNAPVEILQRGQLIDLLSYAKREV